MIIPPTVTATTWRAYWKGFHIGLTIPSSLMCILILTQLVYVTIPIEMGNIRTPYLQKTKLKHSRITHLAQGHMANRAAEYEFKPMHSGSPSVESLPPTCPLLKLMHSFRTD